MSSDGYFEGDDMDDAVFEELDAIEAGLVSSEQPALVLPPSYNSKAISREDSLYDMTFDIDENELQKLDDFIEDAYQGKAQPVAGPSRTNSATHQTTLFGDVLSPSSSKPRSQIQRTKSTSRNPFGQQAPKTKTWDQTAFAKSGLKQGKEKAKKKTSYDDDEEEEEEDIEFEQFPAPFVSVGPPPPMKQIPDLLEAKHWIYPLNRPKRDYQYNIVKHCLFENTIVALPTGLGKTFIAGVVMLNYYRWFPEGKVVFVAPTKPLVAQQIEACHQTCGIPGSDAAELTGQVTTSIRGRTWKEKRVFYMTPQTLVNDLIKDNCDPRDIVLLVIDEAHRATGDYAYNQVVRFLMAKNPHFRILALTATPGGNPEAVQRLIDGLHISRIEIRDENSLDLKQYIHHKTIKKHIINMTEDVNKVKDLLAKLMDVDIKPLRQRGVLWGTPNPVNMHPYAAQARIGTLTKDQRWAYGPLAKLSSLARAMGYLIEGTMGMCYNYLQEVSRETDDVPTGAGKAAAASRQKKLRNDPLFQAIIRELDIQRTRGFSVHPKMDLLKTLVVQHFAQKLGDADDEDNSGDETRVMIFVTFREAVDEIVEALNHERPLIRANKKNNSRRVPDTVPTPSLANGSGFQVIKKFKAGEFNVLVATSIGEEGLDIGEVDMIVCYDAQKTPIRMLQRLGRTGRKREGFVHVLLAEGREEFNLDKAKDTYKEVQKTIWRGEQLELYADVERLLPEHIKPECLEKEMEIQEYIRDEGKKKASTQEPRGSTAGAKRKRNDDVSRNIPTGASMGFVSVADLLVKGAKKQKKTTPLTKKDFDLAGQDDDTDMEIESGLVLAPPRRTKSSVPSSSKRAPERTKLRRSKTSVPKASKKAKGKGKLVEPTSSQFSSKGVDDVDDMEIEQGVIAPPPSKPSSSRQSTPLSPSSSRKSPSRSPVASSAIAVIDLSDSDDNGDDPGLQASPPTNGEHDQSMAWLVDEDEDPDIEIVDSSPILSRSRPSPQSTSSRSSPSGKRSNNNHPLSMDLDESIEFVGTSRISDGRKHSGLEDCLDLSTSPETSRLLSSVADESIEFIMANSIPSRDPLPSSPLWHSSSPAQPRKRATSSTDMPPPKLPRRVLLSSSPAREQDMPEPSFPVKPIARGRRRHIVESPVLDVPPPSQRRLRRRMSSSPQALPRKPKSARSKVDARSNPLFDLAAVHSGDEISEGSSDTDDVEDETDRLFLEEVPETQASPSYNQSLAYRQSLFTQAPAGSRAPAFANRPVRRGAFGAGLRNSSRPRPLVSSSPPRGDTEPDEYAIGSFVVDDEAEVSYLSDD
ncbi:ATP-dependent DNA helicase mph1 [Hypsizygus marmoreus]|uniref:ATP-dependent DNA helicase n=1 Tax=Hypsizygus marmoreus TaxID=39966 RepID=A0A369K6X6_HYPMA|nr:ATP-dependent DNA helicase mph1 [Hypsizygus marmoreus]